MLRWAKKSYSGTALRLEGYTKTTHSKVSEKAEI